MPRALTATEAERLHHALMDLVRAIQFRDRDRICCHDLSVTQFYALEAILRRSGISLNGLAAELYVDKSTASRIVDGLERKGIARREPDPSDGRSVRIAATSEGRDRYAPIEAELIEEGERLLAGMDPAERVAAPALVERIARGVVGRIEREDGRCSWMSASNARSPSPEVGR